MTDEQQDKSTVVRRADGTVAKGTPNPGGQPKWVRKVREALKKDANVARRLLNRVIRGKDILEGESAREVRVSDSVKAAEVVLKFTMPMPKQTHRVEGSSGDALSSLTAEALVAFIKGSKG